MSISEASSISKIYIVIKKKDNVLRMAAADTFLEFEVKSWKRWREKGKKWSHTALPT